MMTKSCARVKGSSLVKGSPHWVVELNTRRRKTLARPMRSVTSALAPSKRSVTAVSRCATPPRLCADALCAEAFADEMRRRGLQTALEQLEEDGPSAFKDPTKVVEYVMLNLQHKAQGSGLAEAFRFSCREPGKSSFVSGNALSTRRISWKTAKVVSGYASGPAHSLADFEAEIREHYGLLLGCAHVGSATQSVGGDGQRQGPGGTRHRGGRGEQVQQGGRRLTGQHGQCVAGLSDGRLQPWHLRSGLLGGSASLLHLELAGHTGVGAPLADLPALLLADEIFLGDRELGLCAA
jgi:hypothetical protein